MVRQDMRANSILFIIDLGVDDLEGLVLSARTLGCYLPPRRLSSLCLLSSSFSTALLLSAVMSLLKSFSVTALTIKRLWSLLKLPNPTSPTTMILTNDKISSSHHTMVPKEADNKELAPIEEERLEPESPVSAANTSIVLAELEG